MKHGDRIRPQTMRSVVTGAVIGLLATTTALGVPGITPAKAWAQSAAAPKAGKNEIFSIEGVPVDITAQSAAAARTQAIATGQRKAFDLLMQRLLPSAERGRIGSIDAATVSRMVTGFEVAHERSSAVRYIAALNFRFDGNRVRDFLRNRSVGFSQTMGQPLLVLPVLESAGLRLLWEPENAWRQAWQGATLKNRLIPFVLPDGGTEDLYLVPAAQSLDSGGAAARAIAARYGLRLAITPIATVSRAAGDSGYSVAIALTDTGIGAPPFSSTAYAATEQDLPRAYAEGVSALVTSLDDWWKTQTLIRLDQTGALAVTVPLRQVSDWAEIKRRLGNVSSVQTVTLKQLRVGEADVELTYVGARAQLDLALNQANLLLRDDGETTALILPDATTTAPPADTPIPDASTASEDDGAPR